jgi:monoamine oxidase
VSGRSFTRRGAIGGALAGAAGYAVTGRSGAAVAAPRRRKRDVIVVGGGLAGLAAARRIEKAGKSVVVLEARKRVGGRTLNRKIGKGEVVEMGGQWVGPTQTAVLGLIDELGLKTFDTYVDGSNVYYRDGTKTDYQGAIPPANPASLIELAVTIDKLNKMAATVPPDAPWQAPQASDWDGQTFETWLKDNNLSPEARELIELGIQSIFSAEPRDLSLLFVIFYIATAAGDFNLLINTAGGAQERRIVGGSQRISLEMAKDLGSSVQLDQPVRVIRRIKGGGVEVKTAAETWSAKRVIVTLPPALVGSIRFRPDLPAQRAQLNQRVPMGTVIKCMAVYDEPFWRKQGKSGNATSNTGPVKLTYDNSPPDGSPGVLLGFIEGQEARDFATSSQTERRAAVLESLARYYGPEAKNAKGYLDKSWAKDRWSRGCYVGFTPPGVLLGYRETIRASVGPIHWAGTETASQWAGYMDGAVQSGQRAADEVLGEI